MCLECDMKKDGKSWSVLHLVVKGKWFKMIAAGVKKEDYRDFKIYWDRRLLHWKEALADKEALMVGKFLFPYKNFIDDYYRHYDRVHISLGYSKNLHEIWCLNVMVFIVGLTVEKNGARLLMEDLIIL